MSNKERVIQLIENISEHKLTFITNVLESFRAYTGEMIESDEWDLKMIAEVEKENDGQVVSIETLADELGITL